MEKTRTEKAVKHIGTVMLMGVLMLGIILSGVSASDMPEEEPEEPVLTETEEVLEESDEETEELPDIQAAPMEEKLTDTEPESEPDPEPVSADGFVSGVIWLDQNEDGIMDQDEPVISSFPVSLYQDDQLIATTETDADGSYLFEQLEAGEYVVRIQAEIIDDIEYLLPLCGISGDNQFRMTELEDGTVAALSEPVSLNEDTQVTDIHAGMREPAGIMPVSAGNYQVETVDGASLGGTTDLQDAVDKCVAAGEACIITATQDDPDLDAVVTIPAGADITLTSSPGDVWTITQNIEMASSNTGTNYGAVRHFYVEGSLTLDHITLAGTGYAATDKMYNGGVFITGSGAQCIMGDQAVIELCANAYGGGIYIENAGNFTMNEGSEIRNNAAGINAGGVYAGQNSTFTMNNGLISNNSGTHGGGVEVEKGTFVMADGEISENEALSSNGGGVYVYSGSTFKMNGGKISENKSNSYGGGVSLSGSEFELDGGEIIGNETGSQGGGVYLTGSGSKLTIFSGTISGNEAPSGGGVCCARTFVMEDGEISGNEANNGGGVYVTSSANSTFTMVDGEISGNEAEADGGGVYCARTFVVEGGEISKNEADNGGGVYVTNSSNSTFTMTDAEISGNKAEADGGGVYVGSNGTFTMDSGTISGNEAGADGGAIYTAKYSYASPIASTGYNNLTISGTAVVENNSAAYRYALPQDYDQISRLPGTLLNNYDINYKGTYPIYFITYYANNDTTESSFQEVATATGLVKLLDDSDTDFTPPSGYVLAGWNTQADGSGVDYDLGETISIDKHLTLYAVWELAIFDITEKYQLEDGTQVQTDKVVTLQAGDDYEKTAPVLKGHRYLGYKLDGGPLQNSAEVTISAVDQAYTVTYVYEEYSEIIHVSVPVKLLWSAQDSDNGKVISPEYYFYNRSSYDIRVTLQKLTVINPDGLKLVETATPQSGADEVALQLEPQSGWQMTSQISLLENSTDAGLLGKISAGEPGYFDITGTYGGSFTTFDLDTGAYLQPEYEAVFRFELTN